MTARSPSSALHALLADSLFRGSTESSECCQTDRHGILPTLLPAPRDMASLSEQLDAQIASFFSSWNTYTTVLAVVLAAFVVYPLVFFEEPDTHPLLLARQARPAPVRQPGESAVYRSIESAYGYPLRSGLNVKDADSPKWAMGRDGDLRDIWRSTVAGGAEGEKGIIMTVSGKEAAEEHDLDDISKSINAIGMHLQKHGKKAAIYLPNCVEYLSTVFGTSDCKVAQDRPLTFSSLCILRTVPDSAALQSAS